VKSLGRVIALVLAGVFFGACGSSSTGMDDDAAAWLQAEVGAAREAAGAADYIGALGALDRVNQSVVQFRSEDRITQDRANEIAAAVEATRAAIVSLQPASTTVPTTTPPASNDEGDDDNGNEDGGRGGGKGHGKEKGDD
jgi:hypothetical protein